MIWEGFRLVISSQHHYRGGLSRWVTWDRSYLPKEESRYLRCLKPWDGTNPLVKQHLGNQGGVFVRHGLLLLEFQEQLHEQSSSNTSIGTRKELFAFWLSKRNAVGFGSSVLSAGWGTGEEQHRASLCSSAPAARWAALQLRDPWKVLLPGCTKAASKVHITQRGLWKVSWGIQAVLYAIIFSTKLKEILCKYTRCPLLHGIGSPRISSANEILLWESLDFLMTLEKQPSPPAAANTASGPLPLSHCLRSPSPTFCSCLWPSALSKPFAL